MDDDLVGRLRRYEGLSRKGKLILGGNFHATLIEAADALERQREEIERLRAICRDIEDAATKSQPHGDFYTARILQLTEDAKRTALSSTTTERGDS